MILDPTPDHSNRLAAWLGRILHPAIVAVPTLLLVLSELGWGEALRWSLLVLPIVLVPGLITVTLLERRGRLVHQRQTRTPLYIVAWLSVAVCLTIVVALGAPRVLIASLTALLVWLPLQLAINTFITKVSAHTAVVAGCYMGLLLLGRLDTWGLRLGLLALVIAVVWARVVTKNHTPTQVVMGLLVGILPVLIVFPLILSA